MTFQPTIDDLQRADLAEITWSGSPSHIKNVSLQLERRDTGAVDYLVVHDGDGTPIAKGAVDYEQSPGAGTIIQLATRSELEGRGLATAIIREAERRIRERGLETAIVGVEPANTRARRLYEHLGYEPLAERETGWEQEFEDGSVRWYSTVILDLSKQLRTAGTDRAIGAARARRTCEAPDMEILEFDGDAGRLVERFDSRQAHDLGVARVEGSGSVSVIRLGSDGLLGRHQAVVAQLFSVVEGEGWVAGHDGVRAPIRSGQAAYWAAGEEHESGSQAGMAALVIEADTCAVRPGPRDG